MTAASELQEIMNRPGFGSGRAYLDRKAQEKEAVALLPDRKRMAPVMASTNLDNWMICSFGAGDDGEDWFLVTDQVRASSMADLEFPDCAKMDALRVAASRQVAQGAAWVIINAYRLGLLVIAETDK